MTIAIHSPKDSYSELWIQYCEEKQIPYKIVDCYKSDIIQQLEGCDALMWHFHQGNFRDIVFAKQLLHAVEQAGKLVFPDFHTSWHFDDKVGQKYLLEAIGAPLVPCWVFYNKKEARQWVRTTDFPKVFKTRGGSASQNVRLVKSRRRANRLITSAFGRGFKFFDPVILLKERWRLYRIGHVGIREVFKGIVRLFIAPRVSKIRGRDKGYIYFQEFIPGNDHDIRIIVIHGKAFAAKRMVRKNDFRASGSGVMQFDRILFDEDTVRLAFDLTDRLKSQCVAYDFIYDRGKPLLVEISYGFGAEARSDCTGYWDKELNWYEGTIKPFAWMIEDFMGNRRDDD